MLVLAYESPVPPHGGTRLRLLHLARALARDARVTVIARGDVGDAAGEPFHLEGVPHPRSRARALVASLRRPYLAGLHESPGLDRRAAATPCDIVQVSSVFFLDAARVTGAPIVLDAHNVEADVMATLAAGEARPWARWRWEWEARKLERVERAAAGAVDAVVTTSEEDAARFRAWGARRVVVVPNGVDTEAVPFAPVTDRPEIVYVGQYGYRPNERAALELVDDVLPLVAAEVPETRVRLVGRNPTEALRQRESPSVEVVGPVADVVPYLHGARVLGVPLRAGSGTRLKILEAMAAGTPVVSTPLGAAGIDARPGVDLLLAESPSELAAGITRVLRDDDLAQGLSAAGRALVEARYDWSVLTPGLLSLHAELREPAAVR